MIRLLYKFIVNKFLTKQENYNINNTHKLHIDEFNIDVFLHATESGKIQVLFPKNDKYSDKEILSKVNYIMKGY